MRTKSLVIFLSGCAVALPALARYAGDYDPFTYTPGNLIGNGSWVDGAGGGGVSAGPQIESDDLSYSGVQTSGGTGANFGAGNENAMFNLSSGGTGTWDGSAPLSVYFSYELRLSSAPGTGPFQLTALDQKATGPIGSRGAEVVVEDNGSGTGFYIGIMKGGQNGNNVAGNAAGIAWLGGVTGSNPSGGALFNYNTTLLIVGAYNFSGLTKAQETSNGSDDDTAKLWVNPDAAAFGAASAPAAQVTAFKTSSSVKDLSNISSLDLIQADGSGNSAPNGGIDDLRVGLSWADVTPDEIPPNPYVAWAQQHGLTNSTLAAMNYDADGDGVNNLLEYALGGNPTVNDAATVMPHWDVHGTWLDYIFNRRTNYEALGLEYCVETTTNLASNTGWTNASFDELIGPASGEFETVTNRIDISAANSRFIRLRVGYNGLYPGIPRDDLYRVKIITAHGSEGIPVFQDACPQFVLGKQGLLASDQTALNLHAGQTISWAAFDLDEPVTVEVEVMDTNRVHLSDVRIIPSRYQISPVVDGDTICFDLQSPAQYSIEIGTNGYQNGLMIFADPPESDAPSRTNSTYAVFDSATQNDLNNLPTNVDGIYFAKGAHDIGIYSIPQQIKNIYLERGAWVDGALILTNNQGTRIFGRGVLSGRNLDHRSAHGIEATGSTGLTVEGIVVADFKYFALRLISTDTTVSWVKTIGAWTWNSDGISVRDNSQVDHCFIWANDDAIKPYRPNITFSDIEVWQLDNGGTIEMSWGDAESDNVVITNLDLLHAEWDHPGFNRGLLCCVGNHYQTAGFTSSLSNWRIENVMTENPVQNIFQITPDPSSPVNIQNLTLRNWNVAMPLNTAFTNQIVGNALSQPFSGFVFDDFAFNGTNLTQPNWRAELQITPINLETPVVQ